MQVESKYIRSMLQSAQGGNNAALEQLLEMNLDRVYTISHRLAGNQPDAEKLASKTLVEAWKQLNKIRTDVPFKLWIESLNIHLGLQANLETKKEVKSWNFFKKRKTDFKAPDPKIAPLEKEICKLPDIKRKIFVLNKIEKYSIDELFGMVDLSLNEIEEKLKKAESILLKADFIQTSDMLEKKLAELPPKIKAEKKILKDALADIYKIKLENRKEVEKKEEIKEKEKDEVIENGDQVKKNKEQVIEKVKPKPEKVKSGREFGFEITSITDNFKKILMRVVVAMVVAASIFYLLTMGSGDWDVKVLYGTISIDGDKYTANTGLSSDEMIKTDEGSAAEIIVPDIGSINVKSLTEFKRLNIKNETSLINGTVEVDFSNAKSSFSINIPGAKVTDFYLGTVYRIDMTNEKSGNIRVQSGWISVKNKNKDIVVPKNYMVLFDESLGLSMPYHFSANQELIDAITEFFNSRSEIYLERIASLAEKKDAITLWNLLRKVSPAKRFLVYSKLNNLVPHPPEVTERDVLELNEEKFQIWLEEIEMNI